MQMIKDLLVERRLIPFLGAGASVSAQGQGESLPSGRQLANRLAAGLGLQSDEIDSDDLIEVASAAEVLMSRVWVEHQLSEIFSAPRRPLAIHRLLARQLDCPLILTTNYDTLIETAFEEAGRPYFVAIPPALSELRRRPREWLHGEWDSVPQDVPIIVKLHGGSLAGQWHTSIITDDDYFEIGGLSYADSLLPTRFAAQISCSSFLFLGHSLSDPHVRFMVTRFSASHLKLPDFLVTRAISRIQELKLRRMHVQTLQMSIDAFIKRFFLTPQA